MFLSRHEGAPLKGGKQLTRNEIKSGIRREDLGGGFATSGYHLDDDESSLWVLQEKRFSSERANNGSSVFCNS